MRQVWCVLRLDVTSWLRRLQSLCRQFTVVLSGLCVISTFQDIIVNHESCDHLINHHLMVKHKEFEASHPQSSLFSHEKTSSLLLLFSPLSELISSVGFLISATSFCTRTQPSLHPRVMSGVFPFFHHDVQLLHPFWSFLMTFTSRLTETAEPFTHKRSDSDVTLMQNSMFIRKI